jgi:hypothetical protein
MSFSLTSGEDDLFYTSTSGMNFGIQAEAESMLYM